MLVKMEEANRLLEQASEAARRRSAGDAKRRGDSRGSWIDGVEEELGE